MAAASPSSPVVAPDVLGRGDRGPISLEDGRWQLRRSLGLPPVWFDVVVAIVAFATSVVNVAAQDTDGISAIPAAGFALLAIGSLALFWRRRWSLATLGGVLMITVAWTALGYPGNPVFHILASLYAVGRYLQKGMFSVLALAAALAVVGIDQAADGDSASEVLTAVVVLSLSWYFGRRVRVRGYYAAIARERAEHLEWKRATEAQRAIADARAGIARELHDVVAHNVSLMTVQAGVARLVVEDDPEQAQESIRAVEEAGRKTLDELRHLLGVLRPETAADELNPQPALSQLPRLVEQLEQTGMNISLSLEVQSELPVRADLFAYRIVQEAMTNVLKHAGVDATTQVHVVERNGELVIEVTDDGVGSTSLPGSGQGIVGMQERAILLGGTFDAGPMPERGFRVRARLPIGDQ